MRTDPDPDAGPDDGPPQPVALQAAALLFLRRFGLVAAAWTTLLAITHPGGVDRPPILVGGLVLLWSWALVSQVVRSTELWWGGWLGTAIGVELLGPLAGSHGESLAGGVSFLVLAGIALAGQRWRVVSVVALLSATAMLRPAVDDGWTYAGSVSTVLLFAFGGLALTLMVEAVAAASAERERLSAALSAAERDAAVARERSEAAARLHDSVLQTLTAIGRTDDPADGARLASRASQELRDFLRRATADDAASDLGDRLRSAVTAAADGGDVGVSVVGEHPVGPASLALVDAAGEAVRNALRHGRPPVRVLLEPDGDTLVCWVSDRGDGFVLADVADDRLGVRRSIVRRLVDVGGGAELDTDDGCEWRLWVPADPAT